MSQYFREKKYYFQNINIKDLLDNKKFGKTIKPYFSNKELNFNKMLLKEKGELMSNEKQLTSIMNKFFFNVMKSLNLKEDQGSSPVNLEDILKKISFHQSIDKIRKTYESNEKFSYQQVTRTRMTSYFKY